MYKDLNPTLARGDSNDSPSDSNDSPRFVCRFD